MSEARARSTGHPRAARGVRPESGAIPFSAFVAAAFALSPVVPSPPSPLPLHFRVVR